MAGGAVAGTQGGDLGLEVGERLERPVDAGETQVGDLVELTARLEDRQTHLVGRDRGPAAAADRLLDPRGQQRQVVLDDRAALARLPYPADDLGPAERLGDPAALHHSQGHLLDRGEPPAALRAGTAPADGVAVVG